MTDGTTIAIVEDDDDIRGQLAGYREEEGFRVVSLDGGAGLDRLLATGPRPHLVVLDWMLPGEDGLSICRRLREAAGPPVVILTPKDEDTDKVLGLEMGADDYVSKPFSSRVLLARIRAVLRRANGAPASVEPAPNGSPSPTLSSTSRAAPSPSASRLPRSRSPAPSAISCTVSSRGPNGCSLATSSSTGHGAARRTPSPAPSTCR